MYNIRQTLDSPFMSLLLDKRDTFSMVINAILYRKFKSLKLLYFLY